MNDNIKKVLRYCVQFNIACGSTYSLIKSTTNTYQNFDIDSNNTAKDLIMFEASLLAFVSIYDYLANKHQQNKKKQLLQQQALRASDIQEELEEMQEASSAWAQDSEALQEQIHRSSLRPW